jgi:hypothetical protein
VSLLHFSGFSAVANFPTDFRDPAAVDTASGKAKPFVQPFSLKLGPRV